MYPSEDGTRIIGSDGTTLVYKAKRSGWTGEHWFVAHGLEEHLEIACKNAVFSLPGVPEAGVLLDRIHSMIANQS